MDIKLFELPEIIDLSGQVVSENSDDALSAPVFNSCDSGSGWFNGCSAGS